MTAVFVIAALIFAYALAYRKFWFATIYSGAALFTLWWFLKPLLQAKGIRLRMWAAYMDYWAAKANYLVGFGPGSFEVYGPLITIPNPTPQNPASIYATSWMHNDWIQILWEYGLIGALVFYTFYLYLLVRAYPKPHVFAGLMGYGTCMFFYSPLHLLIPQLIFFIYARKALED